MAINSTKTKTKLMTTVQKDTHLTIKHFNVSFNGNPLENVVSEKLLGVIVDVYLTNYTSGNKTYSSDVVSSLSLTSFKHKAFKHFM